MDGCLDHKTQSHHTQNATQNDGEKTCFRAYGASDAVTACLENVEDRDEEKHQGTEKLPKGRILFLFSDCLSFDTHQIRGNDEKDQTNENSGDGSFDKYAKTTVRIHQRLTKGRLKHRSKDEGKDKGGSLVLKLSH